MLRALVPATSANLGPGFDALGLAVDLRLTVTAEPAARDEFIYRTVLAGAEVESSAEADGSVPAADGNLVHAGFKAVYGEVGVEPPPMRLTVDNPIPLARGLGSSSAALVAGAALADAMLDGPIGRDGVFRLTAAMEGHPDNVGPAVYGGFTVAAPDEDGRFVAATLQVPDSWTLLFGVPAFELPTTEARAALPNQHSTADTVLTSARAALWVAAVSLDAPQLLRTASLDVLHQPHREPLVPGLARTIASLRHAGAYAAFLSGAGPTVGAVVGAETADACEAVMREFVTVGAPRQTTLGGRRAGTVLRLRTATGYVVDRW